MREFSYVLAGVCGVCIWKVAALVPSYQVQNANEGLWPTKALLAMAGIIYLVCGVLVYRRVPGRASTLFVAFCICAGLHWGGPIKMEQGQLATGLILFYFLVSSILGETLFLRLAFSFPKETKIASNSTFIRLLYAPLVVAVVLALLSLVAPELSTVRTFANEWFLLLHMLVSNIFPAAVLILFISYLVRKSLPISQKPYVALMVVSMLLAWVPYTIASSVGVETDPWNLTVVAIPISFAIALFAFRQPPHEQ